MPDVPDVPSTTPPGATRIADRTGSGLSLITCCDHPCLLQVDGMEEEAARFNKQVTKLGRDVKAWPVWAWLKDTVDAFKKTLPLITDLRNPAMRPRHWQQLMEHIGSK